MQCAIEFEIKEILRLKKFQKQRFLSHLGANIGSNTMQNDLFWRIKMDSSVPLSNRIFRRVKLLPCPVSEEEEAPGSRRPCSPGRSCPGCSSSAGSGPLSIFQSGKSSILKKYSEICFRKKKRCKKYTGTSAREPSRFSRIYYSFQNIWVEIF